MSDSKERLAESVSALMDGETSEIELHRILKEVGIDQDQQMDSSDSVRGIWQRYHMVSASIAGEPVDKIDLSASIAAGYRRRGYSQTESRYTLLPVQLVALPLPLLLPW
jgi:sigma-E factor negative regulatory protein RseA